MQKAYLECGKIINTHGCDGGVKLECWCDSPAVLAGLERVCLRDENGVYRDYHVRRASVMKSFVLAWLDGIDDMDTAQSLVGTVVYLHREDVPLGEGDCFIADLIGLSVIHADTGEELGKLADVINAGASDIYVIDTPYGQRMMPAVDEFVVRIDLESGIYVRPIEGMFGEI